MQHVCGEPYGFLGEYLIGEVTLVVNETGCEC